MAALLPRACRLLACYAAGGAGLTRLSLKPRAPEPNGLKRAYEAPVRAESDSVLLHCHATANDSLVPPVRTSYKLCYEVTDVTESLCDQAGPSVSGARSNWPALSHEDTARMHLHSHTGPNEALISSALIFNKGLDELP